MNEKKGIFEEWKKTNIRELLSDSFAGGTPNRSRDDYFGGSIPWISSGEINSRVIYDTKEKITQLGLENSSAKWIPTNVVLIAMYGATAGQVAKLKINATSNQAVLALISSEKIMDRDFLYHSLRFNKEKILYLAQGSGQPNLSKDLVERFELSYPKNVSIQKYIANILDICDKVIEQTEAVIAKYKAIKQGMLHDLFTRGLDKNGKLRPTPTEAPELYKKSELGLIPKDWEVMQLRKFAIIHNGIDYKNNPNGDMVPIYGTGGILGYTSMTLNHGPAVLSGRKGSINSPYYVEGDFWNVDTIFCIKTINNNTKWLYYAIEQIDMMKYSEATGVPSITSNTLYNIYFSVPSHQEQIYIVNYISSIENKIQTEEIVLKKYIAIKVGLMKRLLR